MNQTQGVAIVAIVIILFGTVPLLVWTLDLVMVVGPTEWVARRWQKAKPVDQAAIWQVWNFLFGIPVKTSIDD